MLKEHYKVYEEKMKKSVEAVERDFGAVRAGRANASVLNRIQVAPITFVSNTVKDVTFLLIGAHLNI